MIHLSVIIPVYNCAQYLKFGFEKLKPLYTSKINFEIIYVNDGSTDSSAVVLESIQETNDFITILHQKNQGSSGARNTAIDVAQGQYIQFLDSDDYIDIYAILKLLLTAIYKDLDAISYRLDYVNESNELIGERTKQNVTHDTILTGQTVLVQGYNPSSICVFLFKTSFLNEHHLRITPKITHMDIEFTSRMMIYAKKVLFEDVIAYHYLQRQGSITKPNIPEKLKIFLHDEIVVAHLVRNTISENNITDTSVVFAIQKNYNAIVWNLLWRFYSKKNEIDIDFKIDCIKELKDKRLYPIKGPLKTNFQRLSRVFFNQEWVLKILIK